MTRRGRALAVGAWLALAASLPLSLSRPAAAAMPSTFGPVIGSAILCRSHLDNAYFYSYLVTAFGKSYKHEGGAYWFKATDASLWGVQLKDVWVSDDTSELVFIGANTDAEADKLADAVKEMAGVRFIPQDASKFPLRVSNPGTTIAYVNKKSKIYCARYKPLPRG
jgi:hypothetical protein